MWSIGRVQLGAGLVASNSDTSWRVPVLHWHMAAASCSLLGALLIGFLIVIVYPSDISSIFQGRVLNASTATLVPEDIGVPIGLFGIDEFETESPD